eukprot:Nitzschia sp. Nitz4//scaffold81_size91200//21862//22695//NITZ4_004979-RA/size91200-processed-gene-0.100-mRNA-1//1//CDS//3329558689//5897//frame0
MELASQHGIPIGNRVQPDVVAYTQSSSGKMQLIKNMVGSKSDYVSRRACYRNAMGSTFQPPSVVTSTVYDDDETFLRTAQDMIFYYEADGMSERSAIETALATTGDKQTFLESLELRLVSALLQSQGECEGDSVMDEVVLKINDIFRDTLKLLWRESITGYDRQGSSECFDAEVNGTPAEEQRYYQPLKTPRSLHSPIRSELKEDSEELDVSLRPKNSGRQRRRFFPDTAENNRFRARIRLDFKLTGGEPVQNLTLDGFSSNTGMGYAPPSPIAAVY